MMMLLLVLQGLSLVTAQTPVILQAPENVTTALGHDPVTFTCRIKGQVIHWWIDGEVFNRLTFHTFHERGISISIVNALTGFAHEILTMDVRARNNNSEVVCQGLVPNFSTFAVTATLNIADVPLPPSLQFSTVQADTVQVEWSEPFTWEAYPITGYSLTVNVSETEDTAVLTRAPLISSKLSPDTHNYSLTNLTAPTCTNLTFSLQAISHVGNSLPGIVFGALPEKPGVFMEPPGSEVTFARDQTPILRINFTFPSLCPYNDATYVLRIEEKTYGGAMVYTDGPRVHHWNRGGAKVIRVIRNAGLLYKREYNMTISVQTLVGESFIMFEFDTFPESTSDATSLFTPTTQTEKPSISSFTPTTRTERPSISSFIPTTQTENTSTEVDIILATDVPTMTTLASSVLSLSVILGVTLMIVIVVAFAIYGRRRCKIKMKRECVGTIQHFPMVSNPIYETGAIYEEIPGLANTKAFLPNTMTSLNTEDSYVTIAASRPNNVILGEGCRADDAYLPMQSVSVLKDQLEEKNLRMSMDAGGCMSNMYANAISSGRGGTGGELRCYPGKRLDRTMEGLEKYYK